MTRSIPFFDPELERLFDASFDETLRLSVDDYLRREGMSPSRFGRTVLGNAAFVCNRLTNGRGVKLHTADRIRAFMGETPFAVSGANIASLLRWSRPGRGSLLPLLSRALARQSLFSNSGMPPADE